MPGSGRMEATRKSGKLREPGVVIEPLGFKLFHQACSFENVDVVLHEIEEERVVGGKGGANGLKCKGVADCDQAGIRMPEHSDSTDR